jgi:hypothetical protein
MREEKVTIEILKWLELNNWTILTYDFPQSGTGISLHPNIDVRVRTKNKGAIIPDIVAVKGSICLFFENKDKLTLSDFDKIEEIKQRNDYSEAINNLLKDCDIDKIYFGIGYGKQAKPKEITDEYFNKVDFIIEIDNLFEIQIIKGKPYFG